MTNILIVVSSFLTAIATMTIAYLTRTNVKLAENTLSLTEATRKLNEAIKTSTDQHQVDMKKLQINLVAAILLSVRLPPGSHVRPEALKELRELIANEL